MDGSDPAQVIRSLRRALEMSQAEFARAAGWSPSTISSWERGRAKPSRLAFKTILAFAEERGVRYRPPTTALVAMATSERPTAYPPGPRPSLRPLVYGDHGADAPSHPIVHDERAGHASSGGHDVPRWSAEASFRFTLGTPRDRRASGLPRGVVELAVVIVAFSLAFAIREPVRRLWRGERATATRVVSAAHAASASVGPATTGDAAPPAIVNVAGTRAPASRAAAAVAGTAPIAPSDAPAPVIATARLESVLAIGDSARATFRTANDAVTVVVGEWLGARQVATIASDGVTLVDHAGVRTRVRVGQHAPLE